MPLPHLSNIKNECFFDIFLITSDKNKTKKGNLILLKAFKVKIVSNNFKKTTKLTYFKI